jgi:hypothetical protein
VTGRHLDRAQIIVLGDELRAFRTSALQVAWRFARQGDPVMLVVLGDAYSPDVSIEQQPLGALVEKDSALAMALYEQAARSMATSHVSEGQKLDFERKLSRRLAALARSAGPSELAQSREHLAELGVPPVYVDPLAHVSDAADEQCAAVHARR